jgi:hypothetical protein
MSEEDTTGALCALLYDYFGDHMPTLDELEQLLVDAETAGVTQSGIRLRSELDSAGRRVWFGEQLH